MVIVVDIVVVAAAMCTCVCVSMGPFKNYVTLQGKGANSVTQCDKGKGVDCVCHARHLYNACCHAVWWLRAWFLVYLIFCQQQMLVSGHAAVSFSHQHIWPSLVTMDRQLNERQQFVQETDCQRNGVNKVYFYIALYLLYTFKRGLKPLWHTFLRRSETCYKLRQKGG